MKRIVAIEGDYPMRKICLTLFILSLFAMTLAVLLGIPAGIFSAIKRGSWLDQSIMGIALAGYSMPIFFIIS